MRDLRVSRDQSEGRSREVDSGSILRSILVNSRPYLRKPHQYLIFKVHRAVGRALRPEYDEIWVLGGCWVVPG